MLKKILATALAAAMILGLASVAFAASFTDTVDHEREAAIKQLAGLGLLDGYPDGTFKPENAITRAEFAKVMVYAMGLKDAAEMLAGVPVGFPDVEANHWATGYIGISTSQEIVKGYPDGTFGPQNNVTYAEALTMILRALGYGPILDKGPWPTAYLSKAAELKLNKGISISANAPATRGDVAGLIANAVTTPKLIPIAWGESGEPTQYGVSGVAAGTTMVTLLHDMGAEFVTGWLVDSPELLDNTSGKLGLEDAEDAKGAPIAPDPELELAEGTTCAGLLGHKVRAWLNNEDEVFFVEDLTPADAVKSGSFSASADQIKVSSKVVLEDDDTVFVDFSNQMVAVNALSAKYEDADISVIYDGKTAKWAVVNLYAAGVVKDVNLTYDRISFESGDQSILRLNDVNVRWSGAAAALEDVMEGDVVEFIVNGSEAVVVVTRNAVTGEFTKLTSSSVTVDGTAYDLAYNQKGAVHTALGDEVTIYLNKNGEVVYLSPEEEAKSDSLYGVVINRTKVDIGDVVPTDDFGNEIRKVNLVTSAGDEATFDVAKAEHADFKALTAGDIISYKTNSAGTRITTLEIVRAYGSFLPNLDVDKDLSVVEWGLKKYKVTADTVIFDLSDLKAAIDNPGDEPTADDVKVITAGSLLANGKINGGVIPSSSGTALVVAMTYGDAAGTDGIGMVYGSYRTSVDDEVKWVLRILVDGDITDYVAIDLDGSTALDSDFAKKSVITFSETEAGEVVSVAKVKTGIYGPTDDVGGTVYDVRISDVDVENGIVTTTLHTTDAEKEDSTEYFIINEDTLVYDITGSNPKSLTVEDLVRNDKVSIYEDDGVVTVIVLHKD
jgi:hypothetical protein